MDNKVQELPNEEIFTLSEAADYLKIAEKTLLRMIYRNEIPVAKVGNQYRFLRIVLEDWLLSKMKVLPSNDITKLIEEQGDLVPVWRLMDENMIITNLEATNKAEALSELAAPLERQGLLKNLDDFVSKLHEREKMISTAMENGVAIPHLRKPHENPGGRPLIVFGRSIDGVQFDAPGGQATHLFFLLCTDSEVVHLRVLKRLSRLLREDGIVSKLKNADTAGEVISTIHAGETRRKRS